MPTGYTASIQEGTVTELKDYILNCSRNFGALIHMRDDTSNTEIRHRGVGDYHLKQLEVTKEDFEEFKKLTDEEIQNKINEGYQQIIKDKQEGLKSFEQGKQRYLDMLTKVEKWQPPTEEHINLKTFAIEQLKSSLKFDYSDSLKEYYLQEPIKDTIEEYKQYQMKKYLKDIEYHSKCYREEIESVEKVNKWIDDLVNSFE